MHKAWASHCTRWCADPRVMYDGASRSKCYFSCRNLNHDHLLSARPFIKKGIKDMAFLYSVNFYDNSRPIIPALFCIVVHVLLGCFTATVNNVLAELTEMCCVFQRSCNTSVEAFEFAKAIIWKQRAQYLRPRSENNHCQYWN